MSDYKFCNACKQDKPVSEFYRHSKTYASECKACYKIRNANRKLTPKTVSIVPSETATIEALARQGIPALPGKALAQKLADVVIYGCILAEVKAAKFGGRSFRFVFSERQQQRGGLRGDVLILVCRYETQDTFHVFNASDPVFHTANGGIRQSVSWTPRGSKKRGYNALNDEMMLMSQDAWHLIEQRRAEISTALMSGAQLPMLIAA